MRLEVLADADDFGHQFVFLVRGQDRVQAKSQHIDKQSHLLDDLDHLVQGRELAFLLGILPSSSASQE